MAIRAVATLTSVDNFDYTDGTFAATVDYAIIGTDYGDLGTGQGLSYAVEGLDPDSTEIVNNALITSGLKNYLISQNVPFGVLNSDTVVMY